MIARDLGGASRSPAPCARRATRCSAATTTARRWSGFERGGAALRRGRAADRGRPHAQHVDPAPDPARRVPARGGGGGAGAGDLHPRGRRRCGWRGWRSTSATSTTARTGSRRRSNATSSAYERLVPFKNVEGIAVALGNMAMCLITLNDFPRALETHRRARAFCEEHGLPRLVALADYNIAYLYFFRGQYGEAIEALKATPRALRGPGRRVPRRPVPARPRRSCTSS